ncbi:MAG: SMP-30/gluconolactonase/LRE family protein [Burkholderiales bacterium]|nr:SMP-30/gluconolactonase/LRE family protein [Burkholderiales bacterium]
MIKLLYRLLPVLAIVVAYLLFWPVPIEPLVWNAAPAPGYVGPHAVNQKLAGLKAIDLGADSGPEHILVRDGWVYAAVLSGSIVRMRPDGSGREVVVTTGGRPLGFDFDAQGALLVADPEYGAHGGLLRVTGTGAAAKIELLTDRVDSPVKGDAIRYADAVVVAKNGKVYFTDASRRFGAKAYEGTFIASVHDILEHQSTGRLLEYDPTTKTTRVLLADLCFANGVALSADEQSLFVSETGEYRIWKVAVGAQNLSAKQPAPGAVPLLSNLPGYPDNLMRGEGGRLWTGLTKPRGAFIDDNAGKPWLRKLVMRLPRSLWPVPPAYGHVFAFDESGKVLVDLQDPSGAYPETTAVTETADRLYIQSLHAKTLGWMPKPAL